MGAQRDALVQQIVALWEKEGGCIPGGCKEVLEDILDVNLPSARQIREIRDAEDEPPADEIFFFVDGDGVDEYKWWIYVPATISRRRRGYWTCMIDGDDHPLSLGVDEALSDRHPASVFKGFEAGITDLIDKFGVES